MAVSNESPLIDHEPFHTYGTPGMDLVGTDAYFCAESKAETIAEAAAAIYHHIRGVYQPHEDIRPLFILTDDDIGVS